MLWWHPAQPDWCCLPCVSSQNAMSLFRMVTGYFMPSHSSTCNTPLSRQSAKLPISNGNFTSDSRCSCDGCPTLKNDESRGALAEKAHFPFTPGLWQSQQPSGDSVSHTLFFKWASCLNTSYSLSHRLVYSAQTHSYWGRGAFDNNAD